MTKLRSIKNRPTLQDVANLANVSASTVSLVINKKTSGKVQISEETRQRVREAVEALNYRTQSAARALRTRRSNMLALMIPYIETAYHPLLAVAIQREAEKAGFHILIYDTRHELEREREFLHEIPARGLDGVIIHSDFLSADDVARLEASGVAIVIHGNRPTHSFADNVMIDEVRAAEEVVTYLINKGHERIGAIVLPESTWSGALRKQGYLNALQKHSIPVDDKLIRDVDFFKCEGASQEMERLLALSEPPSAVFCTSDHCAIDALLFALDSGLSVPDDVAITGFDDTPAATRIRPRLTTIHKDIDALGAEAVKSLVERINSDARLPARQKIIAHKLVSRESA
jgi:DNA-binding LacI/PurR family transcriptional regulator